MVELSKYNIFIAEGEHVAIVGDNGSGKSVVADAIASAYADSLQYIKFRDSYGDASDREYYLQQRWNHGMWDDHTPSAGELLRRTLGDRDAGRMDELVRFFGIENILGERLITFSSGEMRKYQLTKALLGSPAVLMADNPYIGLDPGTRTMLSGILKSLSGQMTIILILSRPEEIPDFITHVIEVAQGPGGPQVLPKVTLEDFRCTHFPPEVIRFRNVSIRYGDRVILENLDWTVRKGEHWVLTGENGCGKSTLLSLVCADNPMAYACDIDLFGRRRGTGESIWDIKKNIGYVSPEMHRSYRQEEDALNVVASGLFDTVGLFYNVSPEQREACREWMHVFGIGHLAERCFLSLSSGEQRLCLVCRAFVKNPPLLILDEPLHGLDERTRRKVRGIIDDFCKDPEKTLIMVTHYPEEYPSCIDHSLTLVKH